MSNNFDSDSDFNSNNGQVSFDLTNIELEKIELWSEEEQSDYDYAYSICDSCMHALKEAYDKKGANWLNDKKHILYAIMKNPVAMEGSQDPRLPILLRDFVYYEELEDIVRDNFDWIIRILQYNTVNNDDEVKAFVEEYYNEHPWD